MKNTYLLAAAAAIGFVAPAQADDHDAAAAGTPDYALGQNWLCLPGQRDACEVSLATTRIDPDGTLTVEQNAIAENPAFDCFYVYPTVSLDEGGNSDMVDNEEERRVVAVQAAPFQQACRMYAPLYRQVTLTALRRAMAGGGFAGMDRDMTINDVRAAWNHYLDHHNEGRGVLLIGHSQGSGVLTRLIAEDIDGQPVAERMIAAYLIGTNVGVAEGADVGGAFQNVPLCTSADQTGCVVSFVSFREDVPPPAASRFGKVEEAGQRAACVAPSTLLGEDTLDAWLVPMALSSSNPPAPWTEADPAIETPFVRVPGLVSAECVDSGDFTYLAVTTHGDPADPRTDTITGDVMAGGMRLDDWGLHLIDMNLEMGAMVRLAERQAAAWMATQGEE